jgi:ACS family glucarate transporter-like MFS transporter
MMDSSSVERGYRWVILGICSIGSLFIGAVNSVYSPLLPLIKESLGLTYTGSGMFTTAYFVGYTFGQVPWGFVADRFGGRRAISFSILGLSVCTLLSGFANSEIEVVTWRLLSGLIGAGIFVPGIRTISEWFPSGRRGIAIGVFGAGTSIGGILAASVSPIIALSHGWRWSVYAFSVLGFVDVPLIWFLIRESGKEGAYRFDTKKMDVPIRKWSFWVLGFDQFVRLGMVYALLTWLPTFLVENHDLPLVEASRSISLMSMVGLVSNPLGGFMSDRVGERLVMSVSFAAIVPCLFVLVVSRNISLVWISILVLGWLTNFIRGPAFAILPKLFGVEQAGRVTGYQNTFAAFGAVVLPFVISFLSDQRASFEMGWYSMIIFCGLGFVSTLLLRSSQINR